MTKTVLVTGGNRGIGKAIAAGMHALGYRVHMGSRDLEAGLEAAREIGCHAVELDLEMPETIQQALGAIGPVDILINNAGVLHEGSMLNDPQGFRSSMAVMVEGPFELIRLCEPHMRSQNWGRIVNLSSGWGAFSEGLGGPNAYGVAKAALNALTAALVRDLPSGVKINAMCPGWVHTRMGGAAAPRTPEEGADTAIWLATLPEEGPTGSFFRDRKPIDW